MKICKRCGKKKPLTEFYCKTQRKSFCKQCLKENASKRQKRYVEEGRCIQCGRPAKTNLKRCEQCLIKKRDKTKRTREKLKEKAIKYLGNCCEICGQQHDCFDIYDFHHIGCGIKEFEIGERLGKSEIGWGRLQKELDKCLLLCANCHRWIHWLEKIESYA
jgi:hypothetical protein